MPTVEQKRYTPEDLLRMPDGDRYELVDGQLVEKSMSLEGSWVGGQVSDQLNHVVKPERLGVVLSEKATYQCFPDDPGKIRKPDASFIRKGRLTPEQFREGHCRIAPDLAVEVVSPNDLYFDVEEKVREYLRAGVELVWVFNPRERTVRVYRAGGAVDELGEDDELTAGELVPGFRCRVGDLFAPRDLNEML